MIWPPRWHTHGFALPTILISSVVMMTVLVTAATVTEAMHATLDRQYYNQLAREAAESGMARARMCLQANGYIPSWSASYPLQPDKDCTGMNNNGVGHWIINQNNIQTTFSVAYPTNSTISQKVTATGTVQLLRESTNLPWRTFTYDVSLNMGVDLNFNTVAFGSVLGIGAYFGTIAADNTARMVGSNWWGQLGNGTYDNTLTPTRFQLSDSEVPVGIFTNAHLTGYNMFVLTNQGEVWGAGHNGYGQLGNGTQTSSPSPVRFNLPTGKTAQYVVSSGLHTFVLTTDGNLYAVGQCADGALGYNYSPGDCLNQPSPQRVNLPTVTSDPNTIPTTNIATDLRATFVRMQGGRVYGWGDLSDTVASGHFDAYSPVQIGTFGNSGQPTARQVFTDSDTLWIVDSNGALWGLGNDDFGQLAGQNIEIYYYLWPTNKCLDNKYSNGVNIWLYPCNGTTAQQFTFQTDGSIYNAAKNVCIDNTNHSSVNYSPVGLAACDGTTAQKWRMQDDGSIINTAYNVCINDGNGTDLSLYSCTRGGYQYFHFINRTQLTKFNLPSQGGTVAKVWADRWFAIVLTSNGQVWGAGLNDHGQLGNGATTAHQPYPVQFILPNGVTATDVYATCSDNPDHAYCNTFVIGSNGKVYGTGSNSCGQLGDGTTTDRTTPVAMQVIDGTTNRASQVMSGYGTTVILTTNHKVFTVGNNNSGQLGDGTTINSSIPKANKYTNVLPVMNF